MAIGDKARRAMAARMAEIASAEAHEVSAEELNAQDEAAEAAKEAAATATVGAVGGLSLTFEQLKELMSMNQGISPEQIAEIAANAAAKAKMPENKRPPLESVFNPLGERDHPKPKLKFHVYMGSAPVGSPKEAGVLTRDEVEAINTLRPGHFRVKKMDGRDAVVEIKGQYNSNRILERIWVIPPEGDEAKNLYPSWVEFAKCCTDECRVDPMVA